ncbi:MAG TPA: hypothetical protein VHU23_19065 [Rhizomicrobium sp.]|nr:hypothetical protein [Rhizomicrobium sp.]
MRARMHLWGIAAVLGFELSTGRAGATTSVGVPLQLNIASNDVAAPAGADSALLADPDGGSGDAGSDFFSDWFARVKQAQDTQPHWMTPLVTVTPRLEQEVRYDQYWEYRGNGSQFDISDSGKGLELIPTTTNEVLFNLPAYEEKLNVAHPAAGWLDDQFLVLKQRLLSADEQSGNYIVSAFLGVTASSGSPGFSNDTWVVTPTIAAGKGWGDFDVQATVGVAIPFRNEATLGTSVATNIAFQYHLCDYFWPEFEVNDTWWTDGSQRGGKNQVLLTPGLILGRFVIYDRIKAIVGGGYQFAVAPKYVETSVLTPAYNHAAILTARLAF